MEGWIKLHRQLLEWEWYDEPDTFRLFLHCLLKANHKDNNYRGQIVKAGSFLTSRELLSNETGLSIQKVRTSLERLELTKEITTKKSKKGTVLQIVKYKNYQGANQEDNQQNNQQSNHIVTNKQPTVNQIVTTNNNDKKEKNEKNEKNNLKDREYKPNFDKLFVKIKGRPNQDWITEVYEERKQETETCGDNASLFIEKTLKPSLYEFCSSCRKYDLDFFNETACLNYYKKASKGYIDDVDTWRKLLKAFKKRIEDKLIDKY